MFTRSANSADHRLMLPAEMLENGGLRLDAHGSLRQRTLSQSSAKTASNSTTVQVRMTSDRFDPVLGPALDHRRDHDDRAGDHRLLVYRWFIRRLIRLAGRYSPFLETLLARGQGPASAMIVIIVAGLALAGANFPRPVDLAIRRLPGPSSSRNARWARPSLVAVTRVLGQQLRDRSQRRQSRG